MNILIVHNKYQILGGEDVVVENEAAMLERHGHKVVFYIRNNSELSKGGIFKKSLMYVESFFSLRTYRDICRLIRRKKIDIVHVHNTVHCVSPSVFFAAVHMGVPVVQTLHNFRMVCPGAMLYRDMHICEDCINDQGKCRRCKSVRYWSAIKNACYRGNRLQTTAMVLNLQLQAMSGIWGKVHYICLTDFNREKIKSINSCFKKNIIPMSHIHVKPNFVPEPDRIMRTEVLFADSSSVDFRNREFISAAGSMLKERYYIFLGRLEHIKGTHLIVKAFARNGKNLILVGTGEQEKEIKKYLEKNHVTNICLTGQLPHLDAMRLLSKAEALIICPQLYETFGMNVIEAYSFGVPVISNDVGNAASHIIDGVTGTKGKNNVNGLCQAIESFEMLDRRRLSDNARRVYEEKYCEEKNYGLLMECYSKLC